jgi:hypothetical protein
MARPGDPMTAVLSVVGQVVLVGAFLGWMGFLVFMVVDVTLDGRRDRARFAESDRILREDEEQRASNARGYRPKARWEYDDPATNPRPRIDLTTQSFPWRQP